jgi:hypothetical protein
LRAADHHFHHNCVVCDVLPHHFDLQIRQGAHELPVKLTDAIQPAVVFAPGFVVVTGALTEGPENALEIMLIFKPDVLVDQRQAN